MLSRSLDFSAVSGDVGATSAVPGVIGATSAMWPVKETNCIGTGNAFEGDAIGDGSAKGDGPGDLLL